MAAVLGMVRLEDDDNINSFASMHSLLFEHYLGYIRYLALTAARLFNISDPSSLTLLLVLPGWFYSLPKTQTWKYLQTWLAHIYVTASNVATSHEALLMNIDVILVNWCGYNVFDSKHLSGVPIHALPRDAAYLSQINATRLATSLASIQTVIHHITESSRAPTSPSCCLPDFTSHTVLPISYEHVAVGGTFDHLHVGHKLLLTIASWLASKRLIVGVSNMESLRKKTAFKYMESLSVRMKKAREFLETMRSSHGRNAIHYDLSPLDDPYGPTKEDSLLSCIVGSKETRKGCESVNALRQENHLPLLDIYTVDVLSDQDTHTSQELLDLKISSTAIRLFLSKLDDSH